ncbi:uncharacterized protein FOMMEDRAFT_17789 [Fomitiporia mediterranea MF3/22]|uniref:uncharacterized protein n=1 Tax=Fomitiporia mediterranea (strain MF3/22) TaxID=694068 RepID=UPI0004408552|nr:uncharacterized protein FOMMEDRAFT_17789 [Fomitiporia mediterranea MF3/22]EJD05499.1 hypothetical protein FOMMEDRAFT_17789 [Fomitiporia mediterranea MF3/22]
MSSLPTGYTDAAYLRVASMAIGAYELICTLPAEYRFYRRQIRRRSFSQYCTLFILIRYLSVVVVVVSNVGFFGDFPMLEDCRRFMLVSPICKVLQQVVSQLVLLSRTIAISRRSRWVLWVLIATLLVTVPGEFYTNISQRTPVWNPVTLNCISGNVATRRIAWIHYLDAMIFDLVATCISTGYLWYYRTTANRISYFLQTLLYEGLGYFVILTAINIANLVLYLKQSEATQSTGASLGYVIIFIMSQRILLRQREFADKYSKSSALSSGSDEVSVSQRLDTTREINDALRSQFETYTSKPSFSQSHSHHSRTWSHGRRVHERAELDLDEPTSATTDRDSRSSPTDRRQSANDVESGFDVQVRIERTVKVAHLPPAAALGRETYRKPRVMWEV